MAVPILRLNVDDNPKIIVRPETYPITVTGATYYNFIASGETVITQVQTGNLVDVTIYNPSGSSTTWGMIVGDITNQTDLTDYVAAQISASTSGLTSSWNDVTDKPVFLDYPTVESFQTGHTHSYNDLDDLPSLFSGDYDDLTNKPDLSVYLTGVTGYWTSGQTIDYVTGYTPTLQWGNITGSITGQTDLYDTLNQKVDYPIYHDDLQTLGDKIDDNYQELTGLTATVNTYTGTTILTILGDYITGSTNLGTGTTIGNKSGKNITLKSISVGGSLAITGNSENIIIQTTSEGVWGSITGTLSGQTDLYDALNQKVDYPIYHDDLQTLSDEIDALITGVTANTASINAIDLSLYQPVSGMSIYLTGVTCAMISACTTGFTTTTNFNTYTGTTAPQTYTPLITSILSYSASTTGTTAWSGKIIEIDSTGATIITLPSGMTTGMQLSIVNVNTGDVTIAAQGTLQGVGTILATQYTKAEAYHRGSNVWLITGTLTS